MRKLAKSAFILTLLTLSMNVFAGTTYMHLSLLYKGSKTLLFTIDENGIIDEIQLKSISNGLTVSPKKVIMVQKQVQDQLNALAKEGWTVTAVSNLNNPNFISVNYLLEKSETP